MGYQISWLAAKTPKATLLDALRLTDTGVPDDANEAPFCVAELPAGWSIIWSNDMEWATCSLVGNLAASTAVVAFLVGEGIEVSAVTYAGPDGNWHVGHGMEDDGKLTGEWPAALAKVALAAKSPFDIPIDLAFALTGYEYSRFGYEWGEVRFTAATAADRTGPTAGNR